MASIEIQLAKFINFLGHATFAVKSVKTGVRGAQEEYFETTTIDAAEDYINSRNGDRQLWTNLQKLKAIPAKEDGSKKYHDHTDISHYTNVLLDIDAEKPDGLKDYAATDEERTKALSQVPTVKAWLESHGFNLGLELSTGNGAGMVLPIPETKAEPVFIARIAAFLKLIRDETNCNIDVTMYDPGRVIGIPGTINAKLENKERHNRSRAIIGDIPQRIEDKALLDFIQGLEPDPAALKEWNKKYNEPHTLPEIKAPINAEDVLDRVTAILGTDLKLKALLDGDIGRFNGDRSDAEYGVCGKLIKHGFTDSEIDFIMCSVSKIGKWQESSDHYKFDQTLRKLREAEETPAARELKKDDSKGTFGVNPATDAVCRVTEIEFDDGRTKKSFDWYSDCAVYIHTETRAKEDSEFIFVGTGAVDKRPVKFTLPASVCAEPRKFKAELINAFGAKNRVGKINFEMVQKISLNPRLMQRIEVPTWDGGIPLLPGVGLADKVEYRLNLKIPAAVYDGDLQAAKDCLRTLLKVHRYASIVVTTALGAPAVARWHKNHRFGLGIWGQTGTLKTSVALAVLAIFGIGYLDGPKLKAGKDGSTAVGAMEIFVAAGFLPQLYDNLKTVNPRDIENYVGTIHAILEGEEKARGKKDGGLRDSREFACTPIITGEVRPSEASTTARVFNLNWTRADGKLLSEVQQNAALLPVIGYHWLRFLASTKLVLGKDFEAYRTKKMEEFLGVHYVNPGRLATIYTLLVSIWDLLEASPLGDVFVEARESFKAALEAGIKTQGAAVSEETEISRFLSGLEELIAANPGLIQSQEATKTIVGAVIGKKMPEGIFLLPAETLNELGRIKVFTQQPTIESITLALADKKLLVPGEGRNLKYRARLNNSNPRGWYIKAEAFRDYSSAFLQTRNIKNDIGGTLVPTFRHFRQKMKENISEKKFGIFWETKKNFSKLRRNGGNSRNRDDIDRLVDSGFSSKVSVPTSVPTVPTDKKTGNERKVTHVHECGSCPVAVKGDKSTIPCDPCIFLWRATA